MFVQVRQVLSKCHQWFLAQWNMLTVRVSVVVSIYKSLSVEQFWTAYLSPQVVMIKARWRLRFRMP